ncbi:hypothetical protein LguiA_021489 [Lonicera macranthoides]
MKQKVVIRVSMGNHKKCHSKVLKIAASVSGVESVALQGPEKDQILVIGEIDAANLAMLLRKKVGHSEIMSVGPVDQKKEGEKKEGEKKEGPKKEGAKKEANVNKNEVTTMTPLYCTAHPNGSIHYLVHDVIPNHEPSCSIL